MPELGAYTPDMSATQEITVETGGFSAESALGGIRLNIIPREGGNTFSGTAFASYASENLASSNLTNDLKARGLTQANSIKNNGDFNPGLGGPIKRDRLWFYVAGRYMFYNNYAAGMYKDSTRNDPNVWTFNPDASQPAVNSQHVQDGQGHVTWQATVKHKLAFSYADVGNCKCFFNLTPTVAEWARTILAAPPNHGKLDVAAHQPGPVRGGAARQSQRASEPGTPAGCEPAEYFGDRTIERSRLQGPDSGRWCRW